MAEQEDPDHQIPPQIQKRIEAGKGCGSWIQPGWFNLVVELDKQLAQLHPDYVIDQVKEKFGGLRYYVSGVDSELGNQLITDAESKSYQICDQCGAPGQKCVINEMWLATRCELHSHE